MHTERESVLAGQGHLWDTTLTPSPIVGDGAWVAVTVP